MCVKPVRCRPSCVSGLGGGVGLLISVSFGGCGSGCAQLAWLGTDHESATSLATNFDAIGEGGDQDTFAAPSRAESVGGTRPKLHTPRLLGLAPSPQQTHRPRPTDYLQDPCYRSTFVGIPSLSGGRVVRALRNDDAARRTKSTGTKSSIPIPTTQLCVCVNCQRQTRCRCREFLAGWQALASTQPRGGIILGSRHRTA